MFSMLHVTPSTTWDPGFQGISCGSVVHGSETRSTFWLGSWSEMRLRPVVNLCDSQRSLSEQGHEPCLLRTLFRRHCTELDQPVTVSFSMHWIIGMTKPDYPPKAILTRLFRVILPRSMYSKKQWNWYNNCVRRTDKQF